MLTPVFLISLPRSGSTFLQKILMSHETVASTAEPWFLLPLSYMRKISDGQSEYGYKQAINAFIRLEHNCGQEFVDSLISDFTLKIYGSYAKNGEKYFLDKTPRYYHCLDDIARIFPSAKFIVLLRNPVSIFASSLCAFRKNTMRRLDQLDSDFVKGPANIADFVNSNKDKIYLVRYEYLIKNTEEEIINICHFLGIQYREHMISDSFVQSLRGHGDKLGAKIYNDVVDTRDNWKSTINSLLRKMRLKIMLNSFSDEYLRLAGYTRKELFRQIESHNCRRIGLDESFYLFQEIIYRIVKKITKRANEQ